MRLKKLIVEKEELISKYEKNFSGVNYYLQGVYKRDENNRSIEIYIFIDEEDLKVALAHEFGHALGLKHVFNPKAVMYDHISYPKAMIFDQTKKLYKPTLTLTQADREAFLEVCNCNK
ncbi:MAG: matrixin family metalloprotease [Balneolaceae bacterium]|nr:matrixin family metalloprotease [Balneolaceae bacterium]